MDKNKIHIDDWIKDALSNEFDNKGIHQSWSKMSDLLDDKDSKPRPGFWFGKGRFMVILFSTLLASIAGIALMTERKSASTTQEVLAKGNDKNLSTPSTSPNAAIDVASYMNDDSHRQNTIQDDNRNAHNSMLTAPDHIAKNNVTPRFDQPQSRKVQPKALQPADANQIASGDVIDIINDHIVAQNDPQKQSLASTAPMPINNTINNNVLLKKSQVDSISRVLTAEVDKKQIGYSTTNNTLGRVKNVKVTEKHVNESYPNIKNNDHTPVITTTEKSYYKLTLIPLTPVEEFVLQSMPVEMLQSENSDDDIRFLAVVNKEIEDYSRSLGVSKSTAHNNNKESALSLLRDINNYFNFRKNFYATSVMGFNTTPGLWLPLGFQAGLGFHYYISDRFTVGLEGIYNFRNSNFNISDAKNTYTLLSSGSAGSITYYDYEDNSIDREYNVKFLQSFQFPIMFNYHTPKFTMGAGPVVAFTSPIKYNMNDEHNIVERRMVANLDEAFPLASTDFRYDAADFGKNTLIGMNVNFQYNINHQVAFSFRYAHLLWDKSANDNVHNIMKQTYKKPEFRIGLQYKLTKTRRVQYMMPTNN